MELLIIPEKVKAKERPRFAFHNGRVMTYTPKATHSFEKSLKQYFITQNCRKLTGSLEVRIQVYFGVKNKKLWGELKDTRPDIDNYVKSCLDGLNGLAWDDDGQIVRVIAEKYYSPIDYCKVFYKKV